MQEFFFSLSFHIQIIHAGISPQSDDPFTDELAHPRYTWSQFITSSGGTLRLWGGLGGDRLPCGHGGWSRGGVLGVCMWGGCRRCLTGVTGVGGVSSITVRIHPFPALHCREIAFWKTHKHIHWMNTCETFNAHTHTHTHKGRNKCNVLFSVKEKQLTFVIFLTFYYKSDNDWSTVFWSCAFSKPTHLNILC